MKLSILVEVWTEHNKAREKHPVEHDDQFGWEHLTQEASKRIDAAEVGVGETREFLVEATGLLISAIERFDRMTTL